MHHDLKTWPTYFAAVRDGRKNFEIRNNRDRGFQAGDTVTLLEFKPASQTFTGEKLDFRIGYVTPFEQKEGFVVFSLLPKEQP